MKALILVDIQNDFTPTGTLPVPEGDQVVPVVNNIMDKPERRHFSRTPKWGPSDFGCKQWGDGNCLRRPAFVLRPSRCALRATLGLPQ